MVLGGEQQRRLLAGIRLHTTYGELSSQAHRPSAAYYASVGPETDAVPELGPVGKCKHFWISTGF